MRNVIDSINEGQLDRNFGTLTFSVSSLEWTIHAGESCEGSFSVSASDHNLAEGRVVTDDYRMECLTPYFSGAQDEISYRFTSDGINPGTDVHGNFIFLSNRGEYSLPFIIHVEARVLDSSLGPVRNLFHFSNLAKTDWEEAKTVFYAPEFEEIFKESDKEYLSLYKCLSGIKGSAANMDEFLVSIRKKTPVEFIASEKAIEIDEPIGVSRYSMNISRNGWGYTKLQISCEGDFISVDKEKVVYDDFLGNNYQSYYFIDADKLHCGKNYGAIILKDRHFETRIPVLVTKASDTLGFKAVSKVRRQSIVQIMEYYQAFRLKKITARIWITETTKVIDRLLSNDPQDLLARLYQIQILLTQDRNNEANWNIKNVRNAAESVKDTQPYLWCYFLYLCSLSDAYEDCYDENVAVVDLCYRQNPADWRIAWLLSYMSDEYKSMTRKWVMYEETFSNGCTSPVMYLEAAKLMLENPSLLGKLDGFEIQVLRYICKNGMMTEEILFGIRNLVERSKTYDERVVKLLMSCYDSFPSDDLLTSICSQLIRAGRKDSGAFKWYSYGIKQELKITRLFEYYMLSRDRNDTSDIPRTVQLYFSFHSDLDYETNSFLYAYILENRDADPDMYSRYHDQIADFVKMQLEAGHNNRYLCKLYMEFIDDQMLMDEEKAEQIANVFFLQEADLTPYPEICNVVICYAHKDLELKIPAGGKYTEIPIYSDDYCIALEDAGLNRYVISKPIEPVKLMSSGRLLLNIQLILKDHTWLDAHMCMDHFSTSDVRMENEFRFRSLLNKDYFSRAYRWNVTMKLIRFYYDQDRIEELDSFLDQLDPKDISPYERPECIRYMIKRGLYAKAMDWIYRFGPEGTDRSTVAELITKWVPVHGDDPGQYGKLEQQLLLMTFDISKSNRQNMLYLAKNYQGTLKTLRNIRSTILTCPDECRDLEEKMVIQMLYTGAYISEREDIIKSYALNLPDGDVLRAALAELSYEYFVSDAMVKDEFFYVLTQAMDSDIDLNIVCSLAYVKFYAENKDLIDDEVRPMLKTALHSCMSENYILACFRDLADFMPSMSHFADATIIQYKTRAGAKVEIHYIIETDKEGDYVTEKMNEVYGGVFTKAFTLFFGESLQYYITEETGDGEPILSESRVVMKNDIDDTTSQGKFGVINDICVAKTLHDYASVDEALEEYYRNDYMTLKLFGMHKG